MGPTPVQRLTDEQLLINLRELTRRERTQTLAILNYLGEVEHRRIHLSLGYSSMFYFCTKALRYSESAANRRMRAARCLRPFPRIGELLQSRRLTLSVLCVIAADLTPENCDRLLKSVCGRSTREAINLIADLRPIRRTREVIRPVAVLARARPEPETTRRLFAPPVPPPASSPPRAESPAQPGAPSQAAESDAAPGPAPPPDGAPRPGEVERKYAFEFAGSEVFLKKYQRVATLYSRRYIGRMTIETVFEGLMDDYIHRHDPERRIERRRRRAESRAERNTAPPRADLPAGPPGSAIPAARRDEVQRRDGYRCTYVAPDGKRCENTYNLQVDHIRPRGLGGGNEPGNLRVLCAAHNRYMAEKIFGIARMERFTRDK